MKIAFPVLLALAGMLVLPCGRSAAQTMQLPREADTGKKCAICHYRWVYPFFFEHRSTPLATLHEGRDTVADKEMCFSCHDGSVRDARDKICNKPGHTTGVMPSGLVVIPPHLPLDDQGRMACATCHTPHAAPARPGSLVSSFLRVENKDSSLCRECHRNKVGGVREGNHPVGVACASGASAVQQAGGRFGSDGGPAQVICETCHLAHGGIDQHLLVLSLADEPTRPGLCATCHMKELRTTSEPASLQYAHPLGAKPKRPRQVPAPWCNNEKVLLGLQGEMICRTCHKPHQARDKHFLLAAGGQGCDLCLPCHPGMAAVLDSVHNLALAPPQACGGSGQKARDSGPCLACHPVHEGTGLVPWARYRSDHAPGNDAACQGCHTSGHCADSRQPQDVSHPIAVTVSPGKSKPALPLFAKDGSRSDNGAIGCATCHDAHNAAPLHASTPAGKRGSFLRLGMQGPAAHCLACHPDQGAVQNTAHDMLTKGDGYRSVLGRSAQQSGVCGACHAAHGAPQQPYLWVAPIAVRYPRPRQDGQAGEEHVIARMCAGCHAAGGVAGSAPPYGLHPAVTHWPAGGAAESLPGAEAVLFDDQGFRTHDGIVACATCHNAHGCGGHEKNSGQTGLASFLRTGVPEAVCAACHGPEALFRYLYFHAEAGHIVKTKRFSHEIR